MAAVENPLVFVWFLVVAVISGAVYRPQDSALQLMTAPILSKWDSSQIRPCQR
jgi:predicted membrane protein